MNKQPLIEVERAVLGSMLCSLEACKAGIKLFEEQDFKGPSHSLIFQSIQTLIASSQPIDCVTVSEFLRKKGSLATVGGSSAVARLIQFGGENAPFEYYAQRLKGTFDEA